MNSKNLISVIIPVHNVEQYIDECVCSVINQTYRYLEIIIINDGSTDASFDKCKVWEERDERIRVYTKENGGVSSARNFGISLCTGDYISFIDSDDVIDIHFYEVLLQKVNKTHADLAICTFQRFREVTDEFIVSSKSKQCTVTIFENGIVNILNMLEPYDINVVWNKLYKKELFDNVSFPENILYGEDLYIMPDIFEACSKIVYIPQRLYFYRIRDTSASYTLSYKKFIDGIYSIEKIYNYGKSKGVNVNIYFDWYFGAYVRAYRNVNKLGKRKIKKMYMRFWIHEIKYSVTKVKCWIFAVSPKLFLKIVEGK